MIQTPVIQWSSIAPGIVLLTLACVLLLLSSFISGATARVVSGTISMLGFVGSGLVAWWLWRHHPDWLVMSGQLRVDRFADLVTILVSVAGFATVAISWGTHRLDERTVEFHALLLTAVGGMSLLAAANSLLVLFVALELFSISLYVLCALDVWSEASLESGLKYLVIGSVGSAFLLFGSGLVYASTQALRFDKIAAAIQANQLGGQAILLLGIAMILAGLAFKASAAPFHQWTPDVYEGAPTGVTAFMATATKVVALCVVMRILTTAFGPAGDVWEGAVAAIAIASMAIGNIAALVQTNVKRMLAYSSIGHAGYLLIAVAANTPLAGRALLYYLSVYVAMTLAAFAVLAIRERELQRPVELADIVGLGYARPFLGGVFAFSLLSLASFPPTGGFLAKLYLFSSAVDAGKTYLAVIGVLATVVSLGYYLRYTLALYTRPEGGFLPAVARWNAPGAVSATAIATIATGVVIWLGVAPAPMLDWARDAASTLPL
ncbi:MAG TPA: NADH-quinone oxidoreductase subunit N [Gaiellales bacterium]|jgi:NADH-quinone oxidoreductase subunit N